MAAAKYLFSLVVRSLSNTICFWTAAFLGSNAAARSKSSLALSYSCSWTKAVPLRKRALTLSQSISNARVQFVTT
uniref:Putative secreted protein n=1 Tax=Ixodes ricinus TaxID=34613 RepID=A0A6B0U2B3_IXORI